MEYALHILVMVCVYSILATSFNLLVGSAGLFALAHAAFYAGGAYTTAILTTHYGWAFPWPIFAGVMLTACVGGLVALPALRIGGHYLVIVSLALQVIVLTTLLNGGHFTGGSDGIRGVPRVDVLGLSLNSPERFLPLAALAAAICFWICWRLERSPFGRALRAMREDEAAALAIGKNTVYLKVTVFAFAAGLAAVAGGLVAHYLGFVGTDSFTVQETIYILAMVILGGRGNLWGSVVGATVLVMLPEALKFLSLAPEVSDKARMIIYGLSLILILRLRPQGILPERSTAAALARRVSLASAGGASALAEVAGGPSGEVTVAAQGLAKRFGGIVAVDGFSIELKRGVITGLIGPNGAGKTTAFNLLTGFLAADQGSIAFRGKPVDRLAPYRIVRAGMARSFQDRKLFTKMSVLENVLVSLPRQSGDNIVDVYFRPGLVRREEAENYRRAMGVLAFVNLEAKAHELAENLSYAEEKLLVVARLLATGAEVLLFDEPLSGLDFGTLDQMFPIFRELARSGKTICIIEHNLDVIRGICDSAVFLDEGHALAQGTPEEIINDPELAERYFR